MLFSLNLYRYDSAINHSLIRISPIAWAFAISLLCTLHGVVRNYQITAQKCLISSGYNPLKLHIFLDLVKQIELLQTTAPNLRPFAMIF